MSGYVTMSGCKERHLVIDIANTLSFYLLQIVILSYLTEELMSTCIRQTAASPQNSFSLLLSNFVAQYVLIIVVWFFWRKYILVFEK